MEICKSLEGLRAFQSVTRAAGRSLALIPTMGALHAGHLSLVKAAQNDGHATLVTIFVNPTQFAAHEDLATYPRRFEADLAALETLQVDALFAPTADILYPVGEQTRVALSPLGQLWEGVDRPHFFDGVATVVAKLLILSRATAAYFGEKDFQQLQIIRRLATDLLIDTQIIGCPTLRTAGGLALSSRNAYLQPAACQSATALYQALCEARDQIRKGAAIPAVLDYAKAQVLQAGFTQVSYLAHVDAQTLAAVPTALPAGSGRLIAAAYLEGVRLIDNLAL